MRSTRALAWAAAFIALTAVKISFPAVADSAAKRTWTILQGGGDYRLTAQRLGAALQEGKLEVGLRQVFEPRSPAETIPAQSGVTVKVIEPALYVGVPATEPPCEAVQAFLSAQAAYEGCAIPANVTVDKPELGIQYVCPVEGVDSSGFGYRVHPLTGEVKFHYGTDFAAETGEPVRAFADGYVYAAGVSDSYGNYYILSHKSGISTLYAHLSEFVALEGESVRRGQLLGTVGDTGASTGPHLHFELRLGEEYLNPEYYI